LIAEAHAGSSKHHADPPASHDQFYNAPRGATVTAPRLTDPAADNDVRHIIPISVTLFPVLRVRASASSLWGWRGKPHDPALFSGERLRWRSRKQSLAP
jgi:hypothetical protein